MIERHEQPPVDRKLLCARKAASEHGYDEWDEAVDACRRAIELWEEEFGK
jgi:Cdc6-like AAA superfamily ATPase